MTLELTLEEPDTQLLQQSAAGTLGLHLPRVSPISCRDPECLQSAAEEGLHRPPPSVSNQLPGPWGSTTQVSPEACVAQYPNVHRLMWVALSVSFIPRPLAISDRSKRE